MSMCGDFIATHAAKSAVIGTPVPSDAAAGRNVYQLLDLAASFDLHRAVEECGRLITENMRPTLHRYCSQPNLALSHVSEDFIREMDARAARAFLLALKLAFEPS